MGNDLGIDLKRLQRINPLLERFIGEGNQLPGAQTLLWRRGDLVDFQSAGFRDRENRLPVEEDTIFRIYSMTKPLISVAMMMLFEEGHFQLFSPVSEFIPGFRNLQVFQKEDPQTGEWITEKMEHPVTFHELLTHTSGLTYGLQAAHHPVARRYNEMNLEGDSLSLEQVVDKILEQPLAFQPGSHWHYSASTDVLARVVEVISGKSIDAFLRERLFEPLEMKDTGYFLPPEKHDRLSEIYCIANWFDRGISPEDLEQMWREGAVAQRLVSGETHRCLEPHQAFRGGHGLVSTSKDYLNFCRMLLQRGEWEGERLLAPKTVELMTMNHVRQEMMPLEIRGYEILGEGFGLGFGVNLNTAASLNLGSVGTFGWGGLASTGFIIDPLEELILIQMAQFIPPPEQLLFKYLRLVGNYEPISANNARNA